MTEIITLLSAPLGHVLRLSQSPVHCRLQHIPGVADHCHGHSVQVQVSVSASPPKHLHRDTCTNELLYLNHFIYSELKSSNQVFIIVFTIFTL